VTFDAHPTIRQTLQNAHHPIRTFSFCDESLNEAADYMFRHHPLRPTLPNAKIHLFTDGSKHPKHPTDDAWSVVIVGDDDLGVTFQGAIVGKHKSGTDIAIKDSSGQETTSTTIEITALIWALAWVIHANIDGIVTISTDSLGALQLAKRKAFTLNDPDLVRTLCILYDMVSQKIDLQHVHAHEFNPWNEVADAAANHGRLVAVPDPQPQWATVMDGAYQRDWEFLLDADPNTLEAYPIFAQGSLTASKTPTTAEAHHFHKPTEIQRQENRSRDQHRDLQHPVRSGAQGRSEEKEGKDQQAEDHHG